MKAPSTLLTNDHTGALELTPLRSADSADASDVDPPRTMNALGSTSVANAVANGRAPAPPPAFKMSELLYSLHAFDAVARPVCATMSEDTREVRGRRCVGGGVHLVSSVSVAASQLREIAEGDWGGGIDRRPAVLREAHNGKEE